MHGCRLFVPVIVHGEYEDLPHELREGCQYLNYNAQSIRHDFNIGDDQGMSERLYKIAKYVKGLCDKMTAAEDKLFASCEDFVFPQDAKGNGRFSSPSVRARLNPFRGAVNPHRH